ncbi:MAG: hypothetical protein MHMPM18_005203 [Marteilia pararefringens]
MRHKIDCFFSINEDSQYIQQVVIKITEVINRQFNQRSWTPNHQLDEKLVQYCRKQCHQRDQNILQSSKRRLKTQQTCKLCARVSKNMTLRQCCSAGLLLRLPSALRAALLQLRHFKHLIGGSSIATRTTSRSPSASPPSLFKARCAVSGELLEGVGQQLSPLPPSQIFAKLDQRSMTTRRNMTTKAAAAAAADQSESIVEDADHPKSLQRLKPLLFALPRHYNSKITKT